MRQLLAVLIVSYACRAASDPVYKALREAGIQESFPVENLVIHRTGPAKRVMINAKHDVLEL
jgi:hypothetical protein